MMTDLEEERTSHYRAIFTLTINDVTRFANVQWPPYRLPQDYKIGDARIHLIAGRWMESMISDTVSHYVIGQFTLKLDGEWHHEQFRRDDEVWYLSYAVQKVD